MTLTTITIASLAVAVACAFIAWRTLRRERERSAARVAGLTAAIDGAVPDLPLAQATHVQDRASARMFLSDPSPVQMFTSETAPAQTFASETAPAQMFARGAGTMVEARPLLKVAIGFGMAVLIIVAVAMSGERHGAPAGPAIAGEAESQALELLSMRHARQGSTLTVTGLVRNPAAEAPGDIMAVVFAFDRDGAFVSSGRAPLEFATIADGEESPFRVTIPDVKDVSRYRVSFRTADGVVRHVDRRPALAAATDGRPVQISSY